MITIRNCSWPMSRPAISTAPRRQQVGHLLVEMQNTGPMILIVVTHSERLAELMQKRRELDGGVLSA